MINKLFEWLVCPACFGIRMLPKHWILRAAGWCDGEGSIL